ncbi:MAG TPA: histidine phosphatase family protein [Melioribacteraceae bacterium]|nr:histidine phosphatase family protein [Melioribacteraceae bacterium]
MKKLFLIRHAKSSWGESGLTDYERPLNKRGERDAPFMAQLLKKEKINPDAVYSSPALRAITTAEIFAGEIGFDLKKIIIDDSIYDSGIRELETIVQKISESYKKVFLFGHNPAITLYANHLGNKLVTNIPTCGIVGIEFYVESWKDVERGKGKTFFFEFPKKYFD